MKNLKQGTIITPANYGEFESQMNIRTMIGELVAEVDSLKSNKEKIEMIEYVNKLLRETLD